MITEIGPNKTAFYFRIIFQIAFILLMVYFSWRVNHDYHIMYYDRQRGTDWGYLLFSIITTVLFLPQTLNLVFWVTINEKERLFYVKYLLGRPKAISLVNVTAYRTTTIKSRNQSYFGIFVYQSGQKKILISELSLSDYVTIMTFLDAANIKNEGEESFSVLYLYGLQS